MRSTWASYSARSASASPARQRAISSRSMECTSYGVQVGLLANRHGRAGQGWVSVSGGIPNPVMPAQSTLATWRSREAYTESLARRAPRRTSRGGQDGRPARSAFNCGCSRVRQLRERRRVLAVDGVDQIVGNEDVCGGARMNSVQRNPFTKGRSGRREVRTRRCDLRWGERLQAVQCPIRIEVREAKGRRLTLDISIDTCDVGCHLGDLSLIIKNKDVAEQLDADLLAIDGCRVSAGFDRANDQEADQ